MTMQWHCYLSVKEKTIGAALYHCSDGSNLEARQQFCPKTSDSWCQVQADKCNGRSLYKKPPRDSKCYSCKNQTNILRSK